MMKMATSKVWIRRMRVEDIPHVHEIDVASFTLPWPESSYRFEIEANPSAHLWVAEKENDQGQFEIVGMIVVWLIIDEAHIATFAVHPAHRRLGIGQRLLAQALLEMHRMGAQRYTLEVRRSNLAAQSLYRKFGFEVISVRPGYYRDNHEDALIMNLDHVDVPQVERLLHEEDETGSLSMRGGQP
ncbi:ribosomal protein S18-alanine N-acetyltransferase [Thermanaerothrix sp. 4228-RoL]|jgi:ribosomal-protein-alanine N-acetyltransferase|uniref:Ribosomal protein S18-alanine N-acetyltransferase n=1 Tax=Thermanaerothrix solaris TaxID=3058434 RepID=A0ABU3NKI8_9CHLR|nr:ribosomal protein S18-alanine N-acetyltransferase [Thermanaerothrix sp. 4228-RoL]MDT8897368.1 ribosomal protein S18-alanine N-acetyltransferase [Thermanaerothrix sp. 4228-RoL]